MRRTLLCAPLLAFALMLGGCNSQMAQPTTRKPSYGRAMLDTYHLESIDAAVIRERTIYQHHFVTDAAALNDLGRRDLGVLVRHYRAYGGVLTLSRGDASDELYDARLATLEQYMADAGVLVDIGPGLAGGDGFGSERAREMLSGGDEGDASETMESAPADRDTGMEIGNR